MRECRVINESGGASKQRDSWNFGTLWANTIGTFPSGDVLRRKFDSSGRRLPGTHCTRVRARAALHDNELM